jgi:hypothetical protein
LLLRKEIAAMTLLDAPKFDEIRDRRRRLILAGTAIVLGVAFIGWWLAAGRPVDWPWYWNNYWRGTGAVDRFFTAVEHNDMAKAYGVWMHDKDWQQHPQKYAGYSFDRFQQDWGPEAQNNDYGAIQSHQIKLAHMYGNVLIVAILVNGRKSKAIFLAYDTQNHTLGFSPVELYMGP